MADNYDGPALPAPIGYRGQSISVPHLAFPLLIGPNGSFNVIQQDTQAEVEQCVAVILGTTKGERIVVPDFGVTDPTFTNPDANEIEQTIAQWEPRAITSVSVVGDNINVQVALAAPAS